MQSVLFSLTKVNFEKKHKELLKRQKFTSAINLTENDNNFSDSSILYGSIERESGNDDKDDFDSININSNQERTLSPRSKILTKGLLHTSAKARVFPANINLDESMSQIQISPLKK